MAKKRKPAPAEAKADPGPGPGQKPKPPADGPATEADNAARPTGQPLLVEVAWEVCQQVGGIYTVIRSKVPSMVDRWANRYCLLGPYDPELSPQEFEETPLTGVFGEAVRALRDEGVEVHHGRWLVTGQPRVILLNPRCVQSRIHEIKYALWEEHDISSPASDDLVDSTIAFGHLVQRFFLALDAAPSLKRPVIAHFHEWMAGAAIPGLRRAKINLPIIFTTHATMLGRFLAQHDPWFYDHVPFVNWLGDARRFNIESQVRLERAAAHGAHLLTTVSDITAFECEHLLGRKPDLTLPNGLNIERFVAMHEFQNLHRLYKETIHQFVMSHFFPSYTFDLDRTLLLFGSGRYEYRNKGFDLTIEALARLNAMLKASGSDCTVVFFLITRRPCRSINPEVLRRRAMLEEVRRNCEAIKDEFGDALFQATATGRDPSYDTLVSDYWKLRLRRLIHSWQSGPLPTIITHDLWEDDEVLQKLRQCNLINLPSDPVKFVYHPDFITPASPLFGMDYDQFVRGCHLGVFPSFYEPWGYTPLECIARGVPTVTSDLSGFGTYLLENMPDHEDKGIYVLPRRANSSDRAAQLLADWLLAFTQLDRRDRITQRNRVESCATQFDWDHLAAHYDQAHAQALAIGQA